MEERVVIPRKYQPLLVVGLVAFIGFLIGVNGSSGSISQGLIFSVYGGIIGAIFGYIAAYFDDHVKKSKPESKSTAMKCSESGAKIVPGLKKQVDDIVITSKDKEGNSMVDVIKNVDDFNNNFKDEFVKNLRNLTLCTEKEKKSLSEEFGTRWPFDKTFEGNVYEIYEEFSKYAKIDLNSGRFAYIQIGFMDNRMTIDSLKSSKDSTVFSEIIKIGEDRYRYWHGIIF